MIIPQIDIEPESYKSYRQRFNQKYLDKAERLFNGIDSLSLKPLDKISLKNKIIDALRQKQ